nr:MAG TPA: hypothetical protein [Microviridae sp.]
MHRSRNENALVSIKLTDAEKLKIGSMGKEHAVGFHNGIRKVASRDIVILIDGRGEKTRTNITNGINVKHHNFSLQLKNLLDKNI